VVSGCLRVRQGHNGTRPDPQEYHSIEGNGERPAGAHNGPLETFRHIDMSDALSLTSRG